LCKLFFDVKGKSLGDHSISGMLLQYFLDNECNLASIMLEVDLVVKNLSPACCNASALTSVFQDLVNLSKRVGTIEITLV
jgi:hypothetical protein